MFEWIEVHKESRGFNLDRQGISKDFVFILRSDGFPDEWGSQKLPGTDTTLYLDDVSVQIEVLRVFGVYIPMVYAFYLNETDYVYLYPASIRAEQMNNYREWKISVSYDIPSDNGQSQGGGGGDSGPSNGEDNTKEFTQLSFNSTHTMEKRQRAMLREAQKATGVPGTVPYTVNQLAFVGLTDDGIEGAEQPIRSFTFSIIQYMSPRKLNYEFMRKISRLTTCLNQKTFFGFAPTSVMLTGGSATGHLYQNIPVTLEFEVRTNFKFSQNGPTQLAPVYDTYETLPYGKRRVRTAKQFDTYKEPEFPDTAINHAGLGSQIDLPNGVHSGWSIINYVYVPQVNTTGKHLTRVPKYRLIYTPEDMIITDFAQLDL